MKKNKIVKLIWGISIVLILIDQISKFVVQYYAQETIGDGIFSITLIENTGLLKQAAGFDAAIALRDAAGLLRALFCAYILTAIASASGSVAIKWTIYTITLVYCILAICLHCLLKKPIFLLP